MAHAILSPSSSYQWLHCPASVALTAGMPDQSSQYAEEGSKAHRLAELTLSVKWGLMKAEEAAAEMDAIKAELPEAEQHVSQYVQYIEALEEGADVYVREIETKLGITGLTGEANSFGTADCVLVVKKEGEDSADTILHVVDFKYGAGVRISAEENTQLSTYALAALNLFDPDGAFFDVTRVVLHIVQPRMGNASSWTVSREVLEHRFSYHVHRSAERALYLREHPEEIKVAWPFIPIVDKSAGEGESKLIPSRGDFANPADAEKVCKWCKAKAKCPVLRQQLADTLAGEFDDMPPVPIAPEVKAELKEIPVPDTPEHLAAAYRYVSMIRQWADAVEEGMRKNLAIGTEVPGWKLVAGRQGPRKWTSESEAEEILRRALRVDTVYDRKVISPTSAEKLMKEGLLGPRYWTRLNALISRSEGKPAIVPVDDPREAIFPQIETDFD